MKHPFVWLYVPHRAFSFLWFCLLGLGCLLPSLVQAEQWPSDRFPTRTWLEPLPLGGSIQKRVFRTLRTKSMATYLRVVHKHLKRLPRARRATLHLQLAQQLKSMGGYGLALREARTIRRLHKKGRISLRILLKAKLLAARTHLLERQPKKACGWLGKVNRRTFGNAHFLRAQGLLLKAECLRRQKDFAYAEKIYRLLLSKTFPTPRGQRLPGVAKLEDWVRLRLLESWQKGGKSKKAIRAGVVFLRRFKRHPLANHVRFVVAGSLKEAGRSKKALLWYRRLRTRYGARGRLQRKALLAEARLLKSMKKHKAAEKVALVLLRKWPGTGEAHKALQWLKPFPQRPAMLLAVAKHNRRRGQFKKAAKLVIKAIKRRGKSNAPWVRKAREQLGKDWFRAKQYPEAIAAFRRYLKWYPRSSQAVRLELTMIRANFRQLRNDASVRAYETFWKKHRRSRYGRMSLWWAAQLWSERKNGRERGIKLFLRYAQLYKRSYKARAALLKVGLVRYRQKRYNRALQRFRKLRRGRSRMATRALFWMGKCYQKLGNKKAMRAVWKRVRFLGDPYYYARVRELLYKKKLLKQKALLTGLLPDWGEEKKIRSSLSRWASQQFQANLSNILTRLQQEDGFQRFRLLILGGWTTEARKVMRAWSRKSSYKWLRPLIAARLWMLAGEPRKAIYAQGRWRRSIPRSKRRGIPSRLWWRLRFPIPFPLLYQKYSDLSGVPALLMMSITRQESLFDPSARSRAGALGIAQMMPKEARKMARKMGLKGFQTKDLFRVSLNLKMGFLHFKEYLHKFENNVPMTLVAYNAGPHSLKRWMGEFGVHPSSDIDAFVEIAVGYRETRGYVPSCLRWYSTYLSVFSKKKRE